MKEIDIKPCLLTFSADIKSNRQECDLKWLLFLCSSYCGNLGMKALCHWTQLEPKPAHHLVIQDQDYLAWHNTLPPNSPLCI